VQSLAYLSRTLLLLALPPLLKLLVKTGLELLDLGLLFALALLLQLLM
jgi:hypothetical protein